MTADHEEFRVVTMSESEPRDGQGPSEPAASDFSIITPWDQTRNEYCWSARNWIFAADTLLFYCSAVWCRGWILQLAVCQWSPVLPSQLRVRADPLMSFRDWHICQIDKCVFSWKEVIICNSAQAPLEDACIFHLSYLLIQNSIIDQSYATLTEFGLLIGFKILGVLFVKITHGISIGWRMNFVETSAILK